jgi:hypothetical protein
MEADFTLCEHCLADNELRNEIASRGVPIESCLICKSVGGRALSVKDVRVKRIFRALIRLNFSEWDYNHHLGGTSLQELILDSNLILRDPKNVSIADFEDAFMALEKSWYPESSDDISLGGGYWDGGILTAIRGDKDFAVSATLRHAFKVNYFAIESEVTSLIDSLRSDITRVIDVGEKYFRARIGVEARLKKVTHHPLPFAPGYVYLPFSKSDIDRPPLDRAIEGRLNRPRVSILYLATDKDTAISELRPHPGHLISTCEFEAIKCIKVADFATHDIRNFLSDARLEILRRILSFASVLNLPVQPDQNAPYLITQLYSDCIRQAGFDGVVFRSSLGPGTNLAVFDGSSFGQIAGTELVTEVQSLRYQFSERTAIAPGYDAKEYEVDLDDPLSRLVDSMTRHA